MEDALTVQRVVADPQFEEDSTYGTQKMNIVPDGVQRAQKSKKKEPEILDEADEQD